MLRLSTRLVKGQYTATYAGHSLTEGQLVWTFQNTSGMARTCPVEPLGLAVRDLKWGDTPAVWGTTPAGRMEVLVDRPTGDVWGRWESDGKTVGRHDEFLLRLPPATVSHLTLRVPSGCAVTAPGQAVSAGATVDGITSWNIVLSGKPECRVLIHQPQSRPSLI